MEIDNSISSSSSSPSASAATSSAGSSAPSQSHPLQPSSSTSTSSLSSTSTSSSSSTSSPSSPDYYHLDAEMSSTYNLPYLYRFTGVPKAHICIYPRTPVLPYITVIIPISNIINESFILLSTNTTPRKPTCQRFLITREIGNK